MLKQKEYDWKDSNLALIGSQLDKDARLDSAETERAWDGVGTKPELKVWRVEKFKIVAWPESKYGKFHTGDSYIVLHTYKEDPKKEKLLYDIYFWIGSESTQDEYGVAAYKTVELDAKLRDAAVEHREVQHSESQAFLRLFKNSVSYLEGGVETGFNHYEPEIKTPELFRFKGTKGNIQFKKVPCFKYSLCSDDVFVLDAWTKIIQWNGSKANPAEKLKATNYLDAIVSARGKDTKKEVFEENSESEEFWQFVKPSLTINLVCVPITLKKYQIKEQSAETDEEVQSFKMKLFRIHENSSGNVSFSKVSRGTTKNGNKVAKVKLDGNDVYLLDTGFIIYLWIGKDASPKEKGTSFTWAMKYIKDNKKPTGMPITQVREGQEPLTFLECLHNNPEANCLTF